MSKDPAFPVNGYERLTMRDWFAGQALSGFVASCEDGTLATELAADAYRVADAMIEARKEKQCSPES